LLIGSNYFAPDIKVDTIKNYLNFLENKLLTLDYLMILLGGINAPGLN
jgi:hypothetical protein